MMPIPTYTRRRFVAIFAAAAVVVFVSSRLARTENKLSEPVYRVAADAARSQTGATTPAAAPAAAPANGAPFDFTKQADEHPLAPVIRAVKTSQQHIDQNIQDYSCTFVKRERVDGQLSDYQHILMKVAHQPFSVYMSFLKPFTGREVLYVAGQNNNKMVVLDAGFKRYLGKMSIDPQGTLAMKGQKRPITEVGIRNLTAKLITLWEAETQFAECEVATNADTKINGRKTTMVEVTHPIPRQNFKAYKARIFFDNELRIPIHYDSYGWPAQAGGEPPLEESYTYQNLKINNGFTARDFDANNNPEIFKQ